MQPLRKCRTGDLAAYKHMFRWIIYVGIMNPRRMLLVDPLDKILLIN